MIDVMMGINNEACSFLLHSLLVICYNSPVMRLHYLWPRKSQNCTIPVNLEAIQTTKLLASYSDHYTQATIEFYTTSSMACNLAVSTYSQHSHPIGILGLLCSAIFEYILKKFNCLQSLQSSTGTASYDLGLQSQHVSSISLVPLNGPKLNHTGSVLFDSVFSRYHGLFWSSVYFNTNFSSIVAS